MIIRETNQADRDHIKSHQRESTRQDVLDTGRVHDDFWEVWPIEMSRRLFTIAEQGGPALAILGICALPDQPDWGFPWLVGATALDQHRLAFLRLSHHLLDVVYRRDPWLGLKAAVSESNPMSYNWLTRWLGFEKFKTFDDPNPPYFAQHLLIHRRHWWEAVSPARNRARRPGNDVASGR